MAGIEPVNDRMCIVTRQSGSADELIRFVAGPDGAVVPDLKRRLPGRGCWVTARRDCVEEAVRRNLFARALKGPARPPADLAAVLDNRLAESLVGMMRMARKAGRLVYGAVKVEQAVRAGAAIAVLHALEASADGVGRIDQARRVAARDAGEPPIPVFRLLGADLLADPIGREGPMHAAALAGQAGEGVVKRAMVLERYRHGDAASAGTGSPQGGGRQSA